MSSECSFCTAKVGYGEWDGSITLCDRCAKSKAIERIAALGKRCAEAERERDAVVKRNAVLEKALRDTSCVACETHRILHSSSKGCPECRAEKAEADLAAMTKRAEEAERERDGAIESAESHCEQLKRAEAERDAAVKEYRDLWDTCEDICAALRTSGAEGFHIAALAIDARDKWKKAARDLANLRETNEVAAHQDDRNMRAAAAAEAELARIRAAVGSEETEIRVATAIADIRDSETNPYSMVLARAAIAAVREIIK